MIRRPPAALAHLCHAGVDGPLKLPSRKLDALAALLALQADIHAELIDGPPASAAWMGLFKDDFLPDLPWYAALRHR
jgi:hypothetical protein